MRYLIAWIALPLLVVAASWGVGLLVEQLTRLRLDRTESPSRSASSLRSSRSRCRTSSAWARRGGPRCWWSDRGAGLWARARSPPRLPSQTAGRWAPRSAVYGLYMAPIVLSGQTIFAGYTLLGDTSVHFSMIDYISDHGARLVAQQPSSFSSVTGRRSRSAIRSAFTTSSRACAGCSAPRSRASISRSSQPRSRSRVVPASQILRKRRSPATARGRPAPSSCSPPTCPIRTRSRAASRSSA